MRVEIDVSQLEKKLQGLSAKNIRFATANAVNAAALRIQAEAVRNVNEIFTIRDSTRQFVERQAAIIKPRANPFAKSDAALFAEIAVGQGKRLLLPLFEAGAQRRPFMPGAKSIAVPITGSPARPTFTSRVPNDLLLKNLRLKPQLNKSLRRELRKATKGLKGRARSTFIAANRELLGIDKAQLIGDERTFVIRGVGVFQRTGPKSTRQIYAFDKDVRLPANLGFLATAKAKGQTWLNEELSKAIANEIKRNEARARR